jgi:hypothetical protein
LEIIQSNQNNIKIRITGMTIEIYIECPSPVIPKYDWNGDAGLGHPGINQNIKVFKRSAR